MARGDISVRWELTFQGLLPREVRGNQYLGNHVGGRGGDMEAKFHILCSNKLVFVFLFLQNIHISVSVPIKNFN